MSTKLSKDTQLKLSQNQLKEKDEIGQIQETSRGCDRKLIDMEGKLNITTEESDLSDTDSRKECDEMLYPVCSPYEEMLPHMIKKFIHSQSKANENLKSIVNSKSVFYHNKLSFAMAHVNSISDTFSRIKHENEVLMLSLVEIKKVVADFQIEECIKNEQILQLQKELSLSRAISPCETIYDGSLEMDLIQDHLREKEDRLSRVMTQISDKLALLLRSELREKAANKQIADLRAQVEKSKEIGTISIATEVLSAENCDLRIRLEQADNTIIKQNIEITALQSKLTTLQMISRTRTINSNSEEQIYSLSMQLQHARDEITQLHSALDEYEKNPGWSPIVLGPTEEVEDENEDKDNIDLTKQNRCEEEEFVMKSATYLRLISQLRDLNNRLDQESKLGNERTVLFDEELSSRQVNVNVNVNRDGMCAESSQVIHNHAMEGSMKNDIDDDEANRRQHMSTVSSGDNNTATASTSTTGGNSHRVDQYVAKIKALECRLKEAESQTRQHHIDLRVSQALLLDAQTSEKCAKEKAYEKDIQITSLRHESVETKRYFCEELNSMEVTLQFKDEKIADSSDTIKNMEIQIKQLEEEMNACKTRLLETEDRVKFDINLLAQKNDRIKMLENDIDNVEIQLKNTQDEFSSATVLLEESRVKEVLSVQKIIVLETEKNDMEVVVGDLKTQINHMENKVSSYTKDLKALQSKYDENISRLENELSHTMKDLEDSKVIIRTSQTREVDAEEKSADLLEQLEQLHLDVEQYKKAEEQTNVLLVSTKLELNNIQELFENTVCSNEKTISSLQLRLHELQTILNQKNDDMKELENNFQVIEAQLIVCKQDLDHSKNSLQVTLTRESVAASKIEELSKELRETKSSLLSVQQELEGSKVLLEEVQCTEQMCQGQIAELKKMLDQRTTESAGVIAGLEARLQEALNGCEERDIITNELNSVLKELDIQLTAFQEELVQMKTELTSSQQLEIELRTSLTTVNEEVKGLQEQLQVSQNNHISVQEKLVQIQRELSDCQMSLQTKNEQLTEMQGQLSECETIVHTRDLQLVDMETELKDTKSGLGDLLALLERRDMELTDSGDLLQKTSNNLIETTRLLDDCKQEQIKTEEEVIYLQSQIQELITASKNDYDVMFKERDEQLSAANMAIQDLQERETRALQQNQLLKDELYETVQGLSGCQTLLEKRAMQLEENDAILVSIRQQLTEARSTLQDSQTKIVDNEQEMTVLRSELIDVHKILHERNIQRAENEKNVCSLLQELSLTKTMLEGEYVTKETLTDKARDFHLKLQESCSELSNCQMLVKDRDARIGQLEHQIVEMQQLFEVTIGSYEEKINDLSQLLKQTETGMADLQTLLQKKTAQLVQKENQLTSTVQELTKAKSTLQDCREEAKLSLADLQTALRSQEFINAQELEHIKSLLKESQLRESAAEGKIAELRSNWNSTVVGLTDCQGMLEIKDVMLAEAEIQLSSIKRELFEATAHLAKATSDVETDRRYKDLISSLTESQSKEAVADRVIKDLQQQLHDTQNDLICCRDLLRDQELVLAEMETELTRCHNEMKMAFSSSKDSRGSSSSSSNDEKLHRLVVELERKLEETEQRLRVNVSVVIEKGKHANELEEKLKVKDTQLTSIQQELQQLKLQTATATATSSNIAKDEQIAQLKLELKDTISCLADCQSLLFTKDNQIHEMEKRMALQR
eukprot:gene2886-5664_t